MTTDTMIPQYNTVIFTDVWSSAEDFKQEYSSSALANAITADSQDVLFYLLYAKYGNSPIANRDITQFKYKVYSIIYQYGPTWEKRLDIQKKLRELDETSEQLRSNTLEIVSKVLFVPQNNIKDIKVLKNKFQEKLFYSEQKLTKL